MNLEFLILFILGTYYIKPIKTQNVNEGIVFELMNKKVVKKKEYLRKLFPNMTKVYGNTSELSYYYINMYVGIPPTRQSLIIDTGSQITAIPCSPLCTSCGVHMNEFYKLKNLSQILHCDHNYCKSQTKKMCNSHNQCSYINLYAENSSIEGVYFEEYVNFATIGNGTKGANVILGCTTNESNLFYSQLADGIMGLGNSNQSFSSVLAKKGVIPEDLFSICLSQSEGFFSLGQYFQWAHRDIIKNFTLINHSNKYGGNLTYIQVNHTRNIIKIDFKKYKTILDSGSTLSLLPMEIFNKFNEFILKECNNNTLCNNYLIDNEMGVCFKSPIRKYLKYLILISMPNITFRFDNKSDYDLTSDEYYYEYNRTVDEKNICTGFGGWNESTILLGSNFMHQHNIIFHRQMGKIGFARTNCWEIAYYYKRQSESREQRSIKYNPIIRNNTNGTPIIVDIEEEDISFLDYLSYETKLIIAMASAVVFVFSLIIILHCCCNKINDDKEDSQEDNMIINTRKIEMTDIASMNEEDNVKDNHSQKILSVLKVKKHFDKLMN